MKATYVGHRYAQWEMEGRKGEYTDVYLVRRFPSDEKEGAVGDKAVCERVKHDMRKDLEGLTPGSPVEIDYDSGRTGKAILCEILPLDVGKK